MRRRDLYSDLSTGYAGENGDRFIYGYTYPSNRESEGFDKKDNLSGKKYAQDSRLIFW